MEAFAAELPKSVHDLDDRSHLCEPPLPTIDGNAEKEIGVDAVQGTQNGGAAEAKLERSAMEKRLGRLSYLRMRAIDIEFTPSDGHKHGGKAEVVKATLKRVGSTDLQVAVKKLRYQDNVNKRKFCNEFVHEVDMMAQLRHQNIARLIGFVADLEEGKAWVVMCWEPNGNVSEFLATGEWEIPERVALRHRVSSHASTANLSRRPQVGELPAIDRRAARGAVLDATSVSATAQPTDEQANRAGITIVTSSNQLTLTGPAWSLRWAAPEVALGEPQSLASDIWAAGWICWEVMTNKVPFPELNLEGAIVLKVVEGHVPAVREDTELSQIATYLTMQERDNLMPSLSPSGRKASGFSVPSAGLLCQMAHVHCSRGDLKESLSLFQQALSVATFAGDEQIKAEASHGLGVVCSLTSSYAEAEQYFTQAQEISTRMGDEFGQASAFHGIGMMYHHQDKLTQAEESYTRARNIFSRLGNLQGEAAASRALGSIFSGRSQYLEAEELYNQVIDISAHIGDNLSYADMLMRLGELFNNQCEYTKAEEFFNRALDKYSRVGANLGRANIICALGHLYRVQGLNAKAASLLAEAKDLYALIGDSVMEVDCSYWLDVASKEDDSPAARLSVPGNHPVPSPAGQQ
ncbi:hypothetical protein FRC01_004280 [Tulasnella sp. 417]|nr:hypothetical protein FRC01_004280 [Tulasnella sp. 417]